MENLTIHNNMVLTYSLSFSDTNVSEANTSSTSKFDIASWLYSLLMEYISYAMISVAVFGIAGNVLIIITYIKIGFVEPINISYCALGVSDICCVTFLTWNAVCFVPAFADLELPFLSREFVIPTGGGVSEIFCETTAWITAYISLERCLCVVFPLRIKTLVTRRSTTLAIAAIFVLTVGPLMSILFVLYRFVYSFDAQRNLSLVRVKFTEISGADILYQVNYFYKSVFMTIVPLVLIIVCSTFLAVQLNRSRAWRLEHSAKDRRETKGSNTITKTADIGSPTAQEDKTQRKLSKDMRVAKTVLLIAVAFIFLGAQNTFRFLLAMVWAEFRPLGEYGQIFRLFARFAFLLSLVNSSVNLVIYYRMGSKFRSKINHMFSLTPSSSGSNSR